MWAEEIPGRKNLKSKTQVKLEFKNLHRILNNLPSALSIESISM